MKLKYCIQTETDINLPQQTFIKGNTDMPKDICHEKRLFPDRLEMQY